MPTKITRNKSWQCLDLAFKIQTDTLSTKLVMLYLAKSANADLSCYPSYKSIMSYLGIKSRSTVSDAIQYLHDSLHIIRWKKGSGKRQIANTYTFDLDQMLQVVRKQAIFDPSPMNGLPPSPTNGLDSPMGGHPSPIGAPPSPVRETPSPLSRGRVVHPVDSNAHGTLIESNAHEKQRSLNAQGTVKNRETVSGNSDFDLPEGAVVEEV